MPDQNYMSTEEAFEIVMDLAEGNMIDERDAENEPDLQDVRRQQQLALDTAHDFILNNILR